MKPLTEDDFGKTIMIGKKPLIEINAESLVFVEIRDKILKNQEIANKWNNVITGSNGIMTTPEEIYKWKEDSKQWKIYLDGGLNNLLEIVEQLKKYLKNIDADILDKEKVHLCDEYSCEDNVREAIQKILGEELEPIKGASFWRGEEK